jgi:hypothetical protein
VELREKTMRINLQVPVLVWRKKILPTDTNLVPRLVTNTLLERSGQSLQSKE